MKDKPIIHDINMNFDAGMVYAVVGPNGAGKSTLAGTIMGLSGYREYKGEIIFDGKKIDNLRTDERAGLGITLAWQEPARFEGLTVEKFITAGAADKTPDTTRKVLVQVGLDPDEYLGRAVDKTLSGGERKKIELASIIAMKPRLVLLDEPDSGIDVSSLENIFEAINEMKAAGQTVVLITHSMAVLKQAEYSFLMCHGTIIDQGTIDKISGYFEKKCILCTHKNQPEKYEKGKSIK